MGNWEPLGLAECAPTGPHGARRSLVRMPGARSHSNSFDALRLAAALAVVIGHAYTLTGILPATPLVLGIAIHSFGVAVFFAISGFLVVDSWVRTPQPIVYFSSRALRILPGLVLVVATTILIIGPVFTTLPLGQYFASSETWRYAANLFPVLPQYDLPGVFANLPYPDAVNGSLWTLRAEMFCYVVVGCLGLLPRVLRLPLLACFGVASMAVALANIHVGGSSLSAAATTWVFFAAAGVIRLASSRWRVLRIEIAAIVLLVWILLALLTPINSDVLAWFALPYVLLTVGELSIPVVRRAARFGDLSYGLYLWAFPVQQALVSLGLKAPIGVDIVVVSVISGVFAMISWHLVEKPALRLKRRVRSGVESRQRRRDGEQLGAVSPAS
jgi:peptidoglycan/LPS O-acetylase OafA/YrhL